MCTDANASRPKLAIPDNQIAKASTDFVARADMNGIIAIRAEAGRVNVFAAIYAPRAMILDTLDHVVVNTRERYLPATTE